MRSLSLTTKDISSNRVKPPNSTVTWFTEIIYTNLFLCKNNKIIVKFIYIDVAIVHKVTNKWILDLQDVRYICRYN